MEAEKNLLRTHTTAVSARMLYRLAREQTRGFRPAKYFSIDRVFRNEAIDRTHLAEFHQVEGTQLSVCWFRNTSDVSCFFAAAAKETLLLLPAAEGLIARLRLLNNGSVA